MKQEKLEIVLSLIGHVGSNPTISANKKHQLRLVLFFAAKMVRMRTGRRSADRKQSAQCNDDDRCLWQKQGGVVGAAF
jgi:hypothetical protein